MSGLCWVNWAVLDLRRDERRQECSPMFCAMAGWFTRRSRSLLSSSERLLADLVWNRTTKGCCGLCALVSRSGRGIMWWAYIGR